MYIYGIHKTASYGNVVACPHVISLAAAADMDSKTKSKTTQVHKVHALAAFRENNKYFELKNSWGAGAPLNSNYLLFLLYCSHPYYMNP